MTEEMRTSSYFLNFNFLSTAQGHAGMKETTPPFLYTVVNANIYVQLESHSHYMFITLSPQHPLPTPIAHCPDMKPERHHFCSHGTGSYHNVYDTEADHRRRQAGGRQQWNPAVKAVSSNLPRQNVPSAQWCYVCTNKWTINDGEK